MPFKKKNEESSTLSSSSDVQAKFQQIQEKLLSHDPPPINEVLKLIDESHYFLDCSMEDDESSSYDATTTAIIDYQKTISTYLEDYLESIAFSWTTATIPEEDCVDDPQNIDNKKTTIVKAVLESISNLYKNRAKISSSSKQYNKPNYLEVDDDDDDDSSSTTSTDSMEQHRIIADHYLDWAIAAKRAGKVRDCGQAHLLRIKHVPEFLHVDSVRLLGLQISSSVSSSSLMDDQGEEEEEEEEESTTRAPIAVPNNMVVVEEICQSGLFETELVRKSSSSSSSSSDDDDGGEECYYLAHQPTEDAFRLGGNVSRIFLNAGYSLANCSKILTNVLLNDQEEKSNNDAFVSDRIFSANSFFNHRHEAFRCYQKNRIVCDNEALNILTYLFLFGISLTQKEVSTGLGGDEFVKILFQARILRKNPVDNSCVIGEVQIYPLSMDTFEETKDPKSQQSSLLFMTDWSMESLRLPRDAVMAIGYDSLELIALASGKDVFATAREDSHSRVLDLCCGCGIQGIFAAKKSIAASPTPEIHSELISMDINKRACFFVTGNACLNGLGYGADNFHIFAVEGDLYKPIHLDSVKQHSEDDFSVIGRFGCILCNPPFVAVPFAKVLEMAPALYSAGGGYDGMQLLRKILKNCFNVLNKDGTDRSILMVTELPNVEDSYQLLGNLLDSDFGNRDIRVAYIEDDVEAAEDYARERENEAGTPIEIRDWNPSPCLMIRNRALVLIKISRANKKIGNSNQGSLFCFKGKENKQALSSSAADEEDLFLTAEGIQFARKNLL